MSKALLIVESPAKAKTISKYLGPDFVVKASVGHVIDLPHNRLGVDLDNKFNPEYVTIAGKEKIIKELKKAAKGKDIIYLGPDPDREGEAIAWHIATALGEENNYKRVLLHELTPQAIKEAIANPVSLSKTKFESQQTRRILDRLMGYLISPILWDKLKYGLSAGRVQSVALRIIVEREWEIFAFVAKEYWSITANFKVNEEPFEALLARYKNKKIELADKKASDKVLEDIKNKEFEISEIVTKERKRHPVPPFTTSTLQQGAFNGLKMASKRTMRVAQNLYEGTDIGLEGTVGLITYMRTDSVRVNNQAASEAINYVSKNLGEHYVPKSPKHYKNKKGAQDAHEAIRPTSVLRTPDSLKGKLNKEHWQLYNLIWRRFVASQMNPALFDQTSIDLKIDDYIFRANGSVLKFDGFLAVYGSTQSEEKNLLPKLNEGEKLKAKKIVPKQHFTQAPARFNEATLVKELEDKGIGRPSTYAAIISTLKDKEYVSATKAVLSPTEMGFAITDLLVENFPQLMDVDFTAGMEENLDQIEEGEVDYLTVLEKMYNPLAHNLDIAKEKMANLKRDGLLVKDVKCLSCNEDNVLKIRYGRNGFYLACSNCEATCDFTRDEQGKLQPVPALPPEVMGQCEKCGSDMVVKRSRYGQFLACSGYPDCKNAKSLIVNAEGDVVEEQTPDLPEGYSHVCEKCGGELGAKKSRAGLWFISCNQYPKCRNAKPFPSGIKCFKEGCDGEIVEKSSKRGNFFGCSKYPKCRTILKGKPVKIACPSCENAYLMENPKAKNDLDEPELICPIKDCSGMLQRIPENFKEE